MAAEPAEAARTPRMLTRGDGTSIAFHHTPGRAPGVMFLGGFKSDMTGDKATRLEAFCRAEGRQFTRFDYRGHGRSSGRFEDGTIGLWAGDATAVLDEVTTCPQVLVGSSMGGWIMLLATLARPGRVRGLVGVAPAPDFVVRVRESLSDDARAALERDGFFRRPTPYQDEPHIVTRRLLEEGCDHLLLGAPIPIDVPVRLLHGLEDDAVPWNLSLELAAKLTSPDVRITFVKHGDHRLSRLQDLDLLTATVDELCRR